MSERTINLTYDGNATVNWCIRLLDISEDALPADLSSRIIEATGRILDDGFAAHDIKVEVEMADYEGGCPPLVMIARRPCTPEEGVEAKAERDARTRTSLENQIEQAKANLARLEASRP